MSTLKEFRTEKASLKNENIKLQELLRQKSACLEDDYARDKRAAEIYRQVSYFVTFWLVRLFVFQMSFSVA